VTFYDIINIGLEKGGWISGNEAPRLFVSKLHVGNNWTDVNIASINDCPVYISSMPVKSAK